jgi:hypothetical protein
MIALNAFLFLRKIFLGVSSAISLTIRRDATEMLIRPQAKTAPPKRHALPAQRTMM